MSYTNERVTEVSKDKEKLAALNADRCPNCGHDLKRQVIGTLGIPRVWTCEGCKTKFS